MEEDLENEEDGIHSSRKPIISPHLWVLEGSGMLSPARENVPSFVNLSHQELKSISITAALFSATNLTVLNLTDNQLNALPSAIGKLSNLRELFLGRNMLQQLPGQIGCCRNLERLYLSCNPLILLPPELSFLEGLTVLELSGTYNTLRYPPRHIVRSGVSAIRSYLADQVKRRNSLLLEATTSTTTTTSSATTTPPHTPPRYSASPYSNERDGRVQQRQHRFQERLEYEEEEEVEKNDKPLAQDQKDNRDALLSQIQRRRLELDRTMLQRQVASLLLERKNLVKKLNAVEEIHKTCCVVCMDLPRSHLCLPCKHFALCGECIQPLQLCPICREPIDEKMQIFT